MSIGRSRPPLLWRRGFAARLSRAARTGSACTRPQASGESMGSVEVTTPIALAGAAPGVGIAAHNHEDVAGARQRRCAPLGAAPPARTPTPTRRAPRPRGACEPPCCEGAASPSFLEQARSTSPGGRRARGRRERETHTQQGNHTSLHTFDKGRSALCSHVVWEESNCTEAGLKTTRGAPRPDGCARRRRPSAAPRGAPRPPASDPRLRMRTVCSQNSNQHHACRDRSRCQWLTADAAACRRRRRCARCAHRDVSMLELVEAGEFGTTDHR